MKTLTCSVAALAAALFLSHGNSFAYRLAPPVSATMHALSPLYETVGCDYRIVSRDSGRVLRGGAELIDATRWDSFPPADIFYESFDAQTGLLTSLALGGHWIGDFSENSTLKLVRQTTHLVSGGMIETSEVIFDVSFNPKKDRQIIRPISDLADFVMNCADFGKKESQEKANFIWEHLNKSLNFEREIQIVGFKSQGFKRDYGSLIRAQIEKAFTVQNYSMNGNDSYHWLALNLDVTQSERTESVNCGFLNLAKCTRYYEVCTVTAKVDGPVVPHLRKTHVFTSEVPKRPDPKDNSIANRLPDNSEAMCQDAVNQVVDALTVGL